MTIEQAKAVNELFLEGAEAFIPTVDDNPDCISFYRAWAGMVRVLGKDCMDHWHHLLHEAICWSSSKPTSEQFPAIVSHARYMIERWKRPDEPRFTYSWECAPAVPEEKDAREFFNSEYKRAFPGKRINGKHAKEQWEIHKMRALELVNESYRSKLASFEQREQKLEQQNIQRREEWINEFRRMAEFEELVRRLEVQS